MMAIKQSKWATCKNFLQVAFSMGVSFQGRTIDFESIGIGSIPITPVDGLMVQQLIWWGFSSKENQKYHFGYIEQKSFIGIF